MNWLSSYFYKEQPVQEEPKKFIEKVESQALILGDKICEYYQVIRESEEIQKDIISVSGACFDALSVYSNLGITLIGAALGAINAEVTSHTCQFIDGAMFGALKKVPFEGKIIILTCGGIITYFSATPLIIIGSINAANIGAQLTLKHLNGEKELANRRVVRLEYALPTKED